MAKLSIYARFCYKTFNNFQFYLHQCTWTHLNTILRSSLSLQVVNLWFDTVFIGETLEAIDNILKGIFVLFLFINDIKAIEFLIWNHTDQILISIALIKVDPLTAAALYDSPIKIVVLFILIELTFLGCWTIILTLPYLIKKALRSFILL